MGAGSVVHGAASNITSNLSSNVPFTNITSPDAGNDAGTNPKAYLTVIFFDERFNFVAEGSTTQRVQAVGNGQAPLVIDNIKAPKNGYAYIYISNENVEPVYFDNLRVVHERAQIIEENHYYAYGLKMASLSSVKAGDLAEGELKNRRQYQGAFAEYDEDIQWNEFTLRDYDPQIARWVQQDPYQQFASPYVALGGDPVNMVDPSGGWSALANGLAKGLGMTRLGVVALTTFTGALVGNAAFGAAGGEGAKGLIIGAFAGLASNFSGSIFGAVLQAVNGVSNEVIKKELEKAMPTVQPQRGGPNVTPRSDENNPEPAGPDDPPDKNNSLYRTPNGEPTHTVKEWAEHYKGKTWNSITTENKGPNGDGFQRYFWGLVKFRLGPLPEWRFVKLADTRVIDMRHALVVGMKTSMGTKVGVKVGAVGEVLQILTDKKSFNQSQDYYSNAIGSAFLSYLQEITVAYDPKFSTREFGNSTVKDLSKLFESFINYFIGNQ